MCVTMEPESSSQNTVHLIPVKQEQDCGLTVSATVKGESEVSYTFVINPLNAELNPICYLLALLGAHHFLHVSKIRVNCGVFTCGT